MGVQTNTIERVRTERFAHDGAEVVLSKIRTPNGMRLEIVYPESGDAIRLDALELESLSWQEPGTIRSLAGSDPTATEGLPAVSDREELFEVTNEFSQVTLYRVETDEYTGLEIESPKLGYVNRFGPAELVWIAEQTVETFSDFLETPYGPTH
jgi:hypothetical protein